MIRSQMIANFSVSAVYPHYVEIAGPHRHTQCDDRTALKLPPLIEVVMN